LKIVPREQVVRILVVEDHAEFRGLIVRTLRRRADFEIFEAADGLEAVHKTGQLQPDLVLLDINLPGLHGFAVAERIHGLAPQATFLFMSQESSPDFVRKALSLGAHGYIHKSSAATDLLSGIDAALAGRRFVSRSIAAAVPLASPAPPRHEIRFCTNETAVVDGMTRFLGAALDAGDAAVALVTESHRPRVLHGLRRLAVGIDEAIRQGTYVSFEADEAVDVERFREAITHARAAAATAGKAHPRVAV
jgi:DNA-binding NarL/FixJ family response regulator